MSENTDGKSKGNRKEEVGTGTKKRLLVAVWAVVLVFFCLGLFVICENAGGVLGFLKGESSFAAEASAIIRYCSGVITCTWVLPLSAFGEVCVGAYEEDVYREVLMRRWRLGFFVLIAELAIPVVLVLVGA